MKVKKKMGGREQEASIVGRVDVGNQWAPL